MSLHAIRSLSRAWSAELCRYVASISRSQSSVSSVPRRFVSQHSSRGTEVEEEPILPPSSPVRRKPAQKVKAVEAGDTYKAGEEYYSFGPYTFYEVEDKLVKHRQPQISSSEKMKIFCMDKLAIADDEKPRRLLPEEYGYLVEWPREEKPKPKYKPMYSVMENKYGLNYDPDKGGVCQDRIPL
ncbi:unnamed protein product [Candidula unifasciata]|uniref:NADH dehydrogenase [ubiquinone] flavoprotein 3, mitochondrial n=1 Tax=Candidula unifasciata TaxID=100452 RepID=A0A8S4A310_9EUPU|nr:unnamed protein product [Candidula unifasciata]